MPFDTTAFRAWIENHNSKDCLDDFQEKVFSEIEEEDYPLAVYQLNRCRLPVGLSGLAECLDGSIDKGMTKLYRVWRYLAYEMHIDQTEGDWIQGQLDSGLSPEYEIPTVNMDYGCYALVGAIVFDETNFAHWAGKRLLAYYMKPDLRPINLDGGPRIPFALSMFLYWLRAQGAEEQPGLNSIQSDLMKDCSGPYRKVLGAWGDDKRFSAAFHALCDDFGDLSEQPIPFNGFPLSILATCKIRQDLNLNVPDHPLLKEPVCQVATAKIDRQDPFFENVEKQMAEITPTEDFQWPWKHG